MHARPTLAARPTVAPLLCVLAIAIAAQAQAFDLRAHRGGRGLMPENTLASFDGIITDYPDRLRELMRERGVPVPSALSPRRAP